MSLYALHEMRFERQKTYNRCVRRIKTHDIYRGGESLFKLCRESDMVDIRKVYVIKIKPVLKGDKLQAKLYHGLEDAMRSLYRRGGRVYETYWDLRLENNDGNLFSFYRVPDNLLEYLNGISLESFLSIPDGMDRSAFRYRTKPHISL